MNSLTALFLISLALPVAGGDSAAPTADPVQVFLFFGQSNMEGGDAHARDVDDYPPFVGAAEPQKKVRYSYFVNAGEEEGWTELAPVGDGFGPELTFARALEPHVDAPIAIIKCAIGGTTIAYDWNPESPPEGKQLYTRSVEHVRGALEALRKAGKKFELRAMFWHQGENDMLNPDIHGQYGERLTRLIAAYRRDLDAADLEWFVAEISDKGIWGMDHRRHMRLVREQQRAVVAADERVHWIPTSHLAFEVMGSGQPHYHFGTQGQLQQGRAYAEAYMRVSGSADDGERPGFGDALPVEAGETVRVFVLAGGRSVEGEDSYVAELRGAEKKLAAGRRSVLYRAFLGGGSYRSEGWEPLRAVGHLDNFGPELSLGRALEKSRGGPVAILKIADSAALSSDWDPTGDDANRPVFDQAATFVRAALQDLKSRGIDYELEGVFWHHGGNEAYFGPFRGKYTERLGRVIAGLREALGEPELRWWIALQSSKAPWGAESIAELNAKLTALAEGDPGVLVFETSDLPHERIHFGTEGTLKLGDRFAAEYLRFTR